jgi:allantoinase
VTTIVDMPYDAAGPVVTADRLAEKGGEVDASAVVDVALYGTIRKSDGVRELRGLVDAGAVAFKFSLYETDPVRFPRIDEGDLFDAFQLLASMDLPAVVHAEAQEIIDSRFQVERGAVDPAAHGRVRPVVSEASAAARALELAYWTGARLHIAHVTHPHIFHLIRYYRGIGGRVSGETCAHYLALTSDDVDRIGGFAKVNPPVRDAVSREQLWDCLRDGLISTISTDHAPWPREAKLGAMLEAASGIPGLETFLPLVWTEASRRGISILTVANLLATAPAAIFGLDSRKGRLAVGCDADIAVFDGDAEAAFDAAASHTSSKWSPFDGWRLKGQVRATFLRGKLIYRDGVVLGNPGDGEWLRTVSRNRDAGPAEAAAVGGGRALAEAGTAS